MNSRWGSSCCLKEDREKQNKALTVTACSLSSLFVNQLLENEGALSFVVLSSSVLDLLLFAIWSGPNSLDR